MKSENVSMVFYLKINRNNSYVINNFKHWLAATMYYDNSIVYVVCDNPELKNLVEKTIIIDSDRVEFIESDRDRADMNHILKNICSCTKWTRVGQAHLKTHWHADEHEYKRFWNIDADDTFVCLDPVRIVEMLKTVEEYSKKNGIAVNGLDMWRSMSIAENWVKGDNWSLGITYIDNSLDWKRIMLDYCEHYKEELGIDEYDEDVNLDWYFTYLRKKKVAKIETFYFENLKFMHFFDYFFNYPHLSMFCQWKEGYIHYPILENCFGTHKISKLKIADDVIAFDIGINEDEALVTLAVNSGERFAFVHELNCEDLNIANVMKKRNDYYMRQEACTDIVCWGTGVSFRRNINAIKKAYDLKYVCDNDSTKWNTFVHEGIKCISPDELKKMKNVFIIVSVDSVSANYKIVHQLMDMGITKFDHVTNWLEYVIGND